MKKYIVKALYVSGKGNKQFNSGDKVTENNFPEGNADLLVEQGFLVVDESGDELTASASAETVETDFEDPIKKYIVVALSVPGKTEVFKSGDKVTNADFDNADSLVEQGFLKVNASEDDAEVESDELIALKNECKEKEIEFADDADVETLQNLLNEYQYNIDLANARATCLSKGIAYAEDATLESLNEELKNFEWKGIQEVEALKATCVENQIEFPEDATAEVLQGLIKTFEDANVIAGFTGKEFTTGTGEKKMVLKIDDITHKQLCAELKSANAEFDSQSKKPVLFMQWIKL